MVGSFLVRLFAFLSLNGWHTAAYHKKQLRKKSAMMTKINQTLTHQTKVGCRTVSAKKWCGGPCFNLDGGEEPNHMITCLSKKNCLFVFSCLELSKSHDVLTSYTERVLVYPYFSCKEKTIPCFLQGWALLTATFTRETLYVMHGESFAHNSCCPSLFNNRSLHT